MNKQSKDDGARLRSCPRDLSSDRIKFWLPRIHRSRTHLPRSFISITDLDYFIRNTSGISRASPPIQPTHAPMSAARPRLFCERRAFAPSPPTMLYSSLRLAAVTGLAAGAAVPRDHAGGATGFPPINTRAFDLDGELSVPASSTAAPASDAS